MADAVCARLEARSIRCWIAPRDVQPGLPYGEAIIDGIRHCHIMVLLLSSSANTSPHIPKEVERAVSLGATVIPLRIEEVTPAKSLDYFISSVHWLDALTPPLERHLDNLAETILKLLPRNQPPTYPKPAQANEVDVAPPAPPVVSAQRNAGGRKWLLPAIVGALVAVTGAASVAAIFWARSGQESSESYNSRPNSSVNPSVPSNPASGPSSTLKPNSNSGPDPLIGCWQWFNNAPVVISSNGTMTAGPFTARWRLADSKRRIYNFTWPEAVDAASLSPDGRTLSGGNQYGFRMSATRLSAGPEIAGTWRWYNGVVVVIQSDGTFTAGTVTGRWRGSGLSYSLTWPNPVDTVKLSSDHTRVDGANQYGVHISGTKTGSCGA